MFLILPFGYGIWVISKSASDVGNYSYGKTKSVPVAYIKSDETTSDETTKYTSIEKALEVAEVKQKETEKPQTVYVIPGANPTIKLSVRLQIMLR